MNIEDILALFDCWKIIFLKNDFIGRWIPEKWIIFLYLVVSWEIN